MEKYPIYPINDQIPSSQSLKNKVLAQMQARNANYLINRLSISQYVPKFGEQARLNEQKQRKTEEDNKLFNKAASSKVAANAMKNIVEPGIDAAMLIEGAGLAKDAIKSGLKSMSKNKLKLSTLEENERFLINERAQNLENLPKMLDAQDVISNFRERIKTPEGQRRMKDLLGSRYNDVKKNIKNLELKRDAQHVAYYQGGNQFFSTNPKIALNASKLDADIIRGVTRHELEHAVQHGYETEIDDMLSNLKLKNDFDTKIDLKKIDFGQKEYMSNNTKAKNYFEQGSRGQEKSAFLSELQQYLVDKKLISHPYAVNEITPKLIESIKTKGVKDYPLRILNIIEPEKNNYQIIANALNKMLIGTGAVAGANKLNSMKNNEK